MCERWANSACCSLWQEKQVWLIESLAVRPCAAKLPIGLWQSLQATLFCSWIESCQKMRWPPLWQDRHCSFCSVIGVLLLCEKLMILVKSDGSSTWAEPGPWQASQFFSSLASRGCRLNTLAWAVCAQLPASCWWQVEQVSWPT